MLMLLVGIKRSDWSGHETPFEEDFMRPHPKSLAHFAKECSFTIGAIKFRPFVSRRDEI